MKRIITTGCGGPAGINFIESIRGAPERIYQIGIDSNKYHLEWPNVDERYISIPFLEPNYIDFLNDLIEKTNAGMVHPQPDGEVKVISDNRKKINAITYLPKKKTIDICQDKSRSAKVWKNAGLPVLDTIRCKDVDDLKKAEEILGYPYWMRASVGFGSRGSTLVENIETARHWIKYWQSKGVPWTFIAQEYLPGKIIAFQSIWKDGELVTSQARERLEYLYPYLSPSGCTNTPVVAKTISRDDVNRMATESVLAVDNKATGVFCVDLRENKRGGPTPTEINAGRFFTTSYFFTKAGINMPYYYVKLAYGERIPKLPEYNALPEGLYWIRHMDAPAVLVREGNWKTNTN